MSLVVHVIAVGVEVVEVSLNKSTRTPLNSNPGTIDKPLESIQKAQTLASAGDGANIERLVAFPSNPGH